MKQDEFDFVKDLPATQDIVQIDRENKKKFENHRLAFARIFKRRIADFKDTIMGIHIGFNIIKFDKEVVKAYDLDGVSMGDKLKEDFGQEAYNIIEELTI